MALQRGAQSSVELLQWLAWGLGIYRLSWLEIYLPLPPECWAESNVLPHQAWQVLVTPKAATSVFQLF